MAIHEGVKAPENLEIVKELNIVGSVEGVAGDIIENMPLPTESAIEAHEAEATSPDAAIEAPTEENGVFNRDVDGKAYSPELHQVDKEGKPRLGKNGLLMKKRKSKKGNSTIGGPGNTTSSLTGEPLTESQRQQAAITGVVSASMLVNLSMMIGGDEFAPVLNTEHGIDEKKALESAFTDYYIATGKTDFPPGVALTLVVGMYILPRFAHQTVRDNLKQKTGFIASWFKKRKDKKRKVKNGAQSNFGNDGKRQDDTREETGAGLQK